MKNRYSPLYIRNQTLRNRIVVPPMASQTSLGSGQASEKTFDHYQRLSEAKPGLLIVEYSYVHHSGKSENNQLAIDSDEQIEGLSKIARIIQASGALAGIQITHAGSKSNAQLAGGQTMGPSAIAVPVKGETLEKPREMSLDEIQQMKSWFLQAAKRAVAAGFDLIEIHSAHGYGLNQWLSPITNQRRDGYGGDINGRARLLLEIVTLIREAVRGTLVSIRLPGQDFIEGGLTTEDSIQIARLLQAAGADILHISSGIGGWRRPTDRAGEGYLVEEARGIAASVQIPIIGVGGIQSGAYIDSSLASHYFSLAAIGRAILQDPIAWRKTHLS